MLIVCVCLAFSDLWSNCFLSPLTTHFKTNSWNVREAVFACRSCIRLQYPSLAPALNFSLHLSNNRLPTSVQAVGQPSWNPQISPRLRARMTMALNYRNNSRSTMCCHFQAFQTGVTGPGTCLRRTFETLQQTFLFHFGGIGIRHSYQIPARLFLTTRGMEADQLLVSATSLALEKSRAEMPPTKTASTK